MKTGAMVRWLWTATLKSLRAVGLAGTLVACAGLGSAEQGLGEERILLGQSLPRSGPLAAMAIAYSEGARAHFEAVNRRGGIHGRQIEVLALNDVGDTQRALANTRELIYRHRVFALINYFGAETVAAHGNIVQAERLPLLTPAPSATERQGAYNRYLFVLPPLEAVSEDPSRAWERGKSDAQLLTRALNSAGRDLTREKWIAALEQIEVRGQNRGHHVYLPTHRLGATLPEPRLVAARQY